MEERDCCRGHTLRWMGKSAEAIDKKGVAEAPLRKRVRIFLEAKEINEKGRKQETESRKGRWREMFQRRGSGKSRIKLS